MQNSSSRNLRGKTTINYWRLQKMLMMMKSRRHTGNRLLNGILINRAVEMKNKSFKQKKCLKTQGKHMQYCQIKGKEQDMTVEQILTSQNMSMDMVSTVIQMKFSKCSSAEEADHLVVKEVEVAEEALLSLIDSEKRVILGVDWIISEYIIIKLIRLHFIQVE